MPHKDESKRKEYQRERMERIRRERGIPIRTKQSREERKASQKIANSKYRKSHRAELSRKANIWYHKNKERLNREKREWGKRNRNIVNRWKKISDVNLRKQIIEGYGGKCACCGETEFHFLDIDHIDNDGRADREHFNDFRAFYRWLRNNGFPKDKYQLLCSNCNQGKRRNGGICPHKVKVEV